MAADFPGLGHVAVTVTDIDRGREWYSKLFGSQPVLDEDAGTFFHVVWALGGGALFGIHTHPRENDQPDFSEFRTGLDHVAFACSSRADLASWEKRLDELGIQHGGIVDAPYGSGLSFRDPDNLPLEFFAPPS
jgi:catechol 2,3-dioxygenase-like lactoylglutathione lyase family enzyme